jgi:hypothetical protein
MMTRSSTALPDPLEVRAALDRLLQSSLVPEGSLPAKVLTYVVERVLAGDGKSIKAYTIAVEALGRPAEFDPDRDSTVRVAAMRLRSAMDLYYAGPGAQDPLRIRMVPGSYRPTFEEVVPQETVEAPPRAGLPAVRPAAMPPVALHQTLMRPTWRRLPATRPWLAAVTATLALNVTLTISLVAVQMRVPAQIAPRPAAAAVSVTAETVSTETALAEAVMARKTVVEKAVAEKITPDLLRGDVQLTQGPGMD